MRGQDKAEELAWLTAELSDERDEVVTTHLITERALTMVKGVDHASLTVRAGRSFKTLSATSELAAWADSAQYDLREGPCVDSALLGEWFRSGDVGHDPRWPRWGPAAAARGVGSLLSVRLLSQGRPFGAINLYADRTGEFGDPEQVELAQLFAVHAASALSAALLVSNLETAMTSRHLIGVAQGILMARYDVTAEVAFGALRRVSQETNRKLRDVAAEVTETRALPGIFRR